MWGSGMNEGYNRDDAMGGGWCGLGGELISICMVNSSAFACLCVRCRVCGAAVGVAWGILSRLEIDVH